MHVIIVNEIAEGCLQVKLRHITLNKVRVNGHEHIRHDSAATINRSLEDNCFEDLSLIDFI